MKAHRNGAPETCAGNLLRIIRGEVPFDRVRGINGALIDKPNGIDEAVADAEWLLENYEPRVTCEGVEGVAEAVPGEFSTLVTIKRKEETDA